MTEQQPKPDVFAVRMVDGSMAMFEAGRYRWRETDRRSLTVQTFTVPTTGARGEWLEVARFAAGEWSGVVDMRHLSSGIGGFGP